METRFEKINKEAKELLARVECEHRELHLTNGDIYTWDGTQQRFLVQLKNGYKGSNYFTKADAIDMVSEELIRGGDYRLW